MNDGSNFFDDVHLVAAKHRLVIHSHDSEFVISPRAPRFGLLVVNPTFNSCGDMYGSWNSRFSSSQNVSSPLLAKNISGPHSKAF